MARHDQMLRVLRRRHPGYVDETCWISENRTRFFGGDKGDDAAGYDFRVKTPQADWLYEVKSSLEDDSEFELTANELQVASRASKDGRRRYRVLYIPYVFLPDKWYVLELPNHGRTYSQSISNCRSRLSAPQVRKRLTKPKNHRAFPTDAGNCPFVQSREKW